MKDKQITRAFGHDHRAYGLWALGTMATWKGDASEAVLGRSPRAAGHGGEGVSGGRAIAASRQLEIAGVAAVGASVEHIYTYIMVAYTSIVKGYVSTTYI